MDREGSPQVLAIEERLLRSIEEQRYDDVQAIGKDLLPLIADESHSVRLRIYHLLQRSSRFFLSSVHQWNARAVAEDVMADHARTPEERIRAHMLHLLLGTVPPNGSTVDPQRRWMTQELRELYADQATTELLGRGGAVDPDLRRDAHVVRCFTCPDHQSVTAHLEALLEDGDEHSIVFGCCGAPIALHQETACQFLNRALAIVKGEHAIARLLEYKLCVLCGAYMDGPDSEAPEGTERSAALYTDFIATMARLELCQHSLVERVQGHLHLANFAYWFDEMALAQTHLDIAFALAEHMQDPQLQQIVGYMREQILGAEQNGEQEEGADEEEDDAKYEDEEEDDDDDDKEDFWKS